MLADEMQLQARRLRHADQPGRPHDAVRNGAPLAALPHQRDFRFRLLRLRRQLGIRHFAAAQNLAGVGDVVSVLEFRIADVDRAEQMAARLEHEAGPGYMATTWMDENRALFRALRLEKLVTALLLA